MPCPGKVQERRGSSDGELRLPLENDRPATIVNIRSEMGCQDGCPGRGRANEFAATTTQSPPARTPVPDPPRCTGGGVPAGQSPGGPSVRGCEVPAGSERMNSPLEIREVRLRGLPHHGPCRCTNAESRRAIGARMRNPGGLRANEFAAGNSRSPPSRTAPPRAVPVHRCAVPAGHRCADAKFRRGSERMNSPLEIREVRLRGLPRHGPCRCTDAQFRC